MWTNLPVQIETGKSHFPIDSQKLFFEFCVDYSDSVVHELSREFEVLQTYNFWIVLSAYYKDPSNFWRGHSVLLNDSSIPSGRATRPRYARNGLTSETGREWKRRRIVAERRESEPSKQAVASHRRKCWCQHQERARARALGDTLVPVSRREGREKEEEALRRGGNLIRAKAEAFELRNANAQPR